MSMSPWQLESSASLTDCSTKNVVIDSQTVVNYRKYVIIVHLYCLVKRLRLRSRWFISLQTSQPSVFFWLLNLGNRIFLDEKGSCRRTTVTTLFLVLHRDVNCMHYCLLSILRLSWKLTEMCRTYFLSASSRSVR